MQNICAASISELTAIDSALPQLHQQAEQLLARGIVHAAEPCAQAAASLAVIQRSGEAASFALLGRVHAASRQYSAAQASYERALHFSPSYAPGWIELARMRYAMQRQHPEPVCIPA